MIHEINNGYVKTHTTHHITTIEFFHPQSNSLPGKLLEELATEIHSAGNNPETHIIILCSGGEKAFCAGASFEELQNIITPAQGLKFFSGFAHVINAMRKCPKLIIGRIQGKCVGGGVGLAAATDYCIAHKNASIKLSELAVGIGPFVIGPIVERKIGMNAFSQLAIDAAMWRDAEWAKRRGLFAEVHEAIENMDESINRLANTLAKYSVEAMLELKRIFWEGTDDWDELLQKRAAISGKLVISKYTKAFIQEFKGKTK